MIAQKHTPGPWHVEEEGEVLVIVGPRENCSRNGKRPSWEMAKIDNYIFWDEPETEAEDRANARLIAAAPEMLEALRDLLVLAQAHYPTPAAKGEIVRARAAIAKATGQ